MTKLKKGTLLEEANQLRQRFISWEGLQRLYMPTVMPHRQSLGKEGKAASDDLQDIRLYLLSEVLPGLSCSEKLTQCEFRYCIAQAHVALHDLCQCLVVRQHMFGSKKRYTHGTEAITHSNKKIEVEGKQIAELASRYRSIRQKLVVLSKVVNDTAWQDTLQVLEDKDIQGLTTEDDRLTAVGSQEKKGRMGVGRRRLTWIWFVGGPRRSEDEEAGDAGSEGEGDEDDMDGNETDCDSGSESGSDGEHGDNVNKGVSGTARTSEFPLFFVCLIFSDCVLEVAMAIERTIRLSGMSFFLHGLRHTAGRKSACCSRRK
jgi:hypothetical protein